MLTKGDVLVALGKLDNPFGSAEKLADPMGASGRRASENKATSPSAGGVGAGEKEVSGARAANCDFVNCDFRLSIACAGCYLQVAACRLHVANILD